MNGGNRIHDKYFSTLKALYHGISVLCTIMLMQLTVEFGFWTHYGEGVTENFDIF